MSSVESAQVESSQVESSPVESSQVESSRVQSGRVESIRAQIIRVNRSVVESSRVENGRDGYLKTDNLFLLHQGIRFDSTRPESLRFICQEPEEKGTEKDWVTYIISMLTFPHIILRWSDVGNFILTGYCRWGLTMLLHPDTCWDSIR